MRAEHRHELKTNELALWLSNVPDWVQQNARLIIYIAVVAILVLGTLIYHKYQTTVVSAREQTDVTQILAQLPQQKAQIVQVQMQQGVDSSYLLLQAANLLDNSAKDASDDAVAAMALIKEAEILRTELHFRLGPVSQEDLVNQMSRAKENYNKALDTHLKKRPNRSLEALAKIGLGLCEEELGNLEQARSIYSEVATNSSYDGVPAVAVAKERLESMDYFQQNIVFQPAPRPLAPPVPPAALTEPAPEAAPQVEVVPVLPQAAPAPEANAPATN